MRLTPDQQSAIRAIAAETFGDEASIWLFGSRIDDNKRGGDIDLLIETNQSMGSRLFPAILSYLTEQFEDRPMLDKLNRLEKLGFIDSVEQWQTVRNIRNKFGHDYPDDPNKSAAHLNLALESVSVLYDMLTTISTQLNTAYPLLELGKALPAYLHD